MAEKWKIIYTDQSDHLGVFRSAENAKFSYVSQYWQGYVYKKECECIYTKLLNREAESKSFIDNNNRISNVKFYLFNNDDTRL